MKMFLESWGKEIALLAFLDWLDVEMPMVLIKGMSHDRYLNSEGCLLLYLTNLFESI